MHKPVFPEPDIKETQGGIQVTLLKNSNQVSIQVGNQAGKSWAVILEEMLKESHFKPTEKAIAKYMSDEETMTENQIKILEYCRIPRKRKEILEEGLEISNQTKNFNANILPLLEKELLQWTIKDRPQSPLQKYLITNKGKVILYIHEHKQK